MGQVSGKGSGHYGCLGATKGTCPNKLLVPRRLAERKVIRAVRDRITDASSLQYVLERLEAEVKRLSAHVPEDLKLKRAALASEETRIANFVDFIGEGKGTGALGQALEAAEQRAQALRDEVELLARTSRQVFEAPPLEWVVERIGWLNELLEKETSRSALLLREVLGRIRLYPVAPDIGRPYYRAETALWVLDLLDRPEGGSNWLRQWRRSNQYPPAARLPIRFALLETCKPFPYQALAARAVKLRSLGMSNSAIARSSGITDKTVAKAIRWHPMRCV